MTDPIESQSRPIVTRAEARANGLSRYFTGCPCKHGHINERYVVPATCVICALSYRSRNHERVRYRENLYAEAKPDRNKVYYWANHAKERARSSAYYAANIETERAKDAAYWAAHPEKRRMKDARRRALKRGAEGYYTWEEVLDLYQKQRGRCAYCHVSIKKGFHCDHIVPLKRGGSNWISNIALSCGSCNQRKSAKDPLVFARQNGRLL